jgi:iron complex outermembrane receptor protein
VGDTWFHTLQNNDVPAIWNLFFQTTAFNADLSKTKRESFDTINARVNLESERWTLSLWGRNIGDTAYLEEVIPAPEFGGSFIHPAALAAYGVEFTFRF